VQRKEERKGRSAPIKMKLTTITIIPIILIIPIIPLSLHADAAPATDPLSASGAPSVLVTERGPHHRILQITLPSSSPSNSITAPPLPPRPPVNNPSVEVHELQTGLHRWTADQGWVETHPRIESFPDGAIIRNLQYGAIFAPNLATPNAFDLALPPASGETHLLERSRLQGHLFGLLFTDANQSVLIAEVKDSVGVIGGPEQNEITYADAFTDFAITVKYIAQRDRLSQLLILEQQLPPPTEWGLTDNAVLEILTEFTQFPDLTREPRDPVDGIQGEHLRFATMEFVTGRAFSIPAGDPESAATTGRAFNVVAQTSESAVSQDSGLQPSTRVETPPTEVVAADVSRLIPIQKQMQQFEGGRWFLVEKVSWKAIAAELAKLPPVAKNWRKKDHPLMARMEIPGAQSPSPSSSSSSRSSDPPTSVVEGRTLEGRVTRVPNLPPNVVATVPPRGTNSPNPNAKHSASVETPSVETPSVETPSVETPSVETPRAEAPRHGNVPLPLNSQISNFRPHAQRSAPAWQCLEAPSSGFQAFRLSTPSSAFVLDWELVTTINSNLWKADTTWYISGPVTVKTNVFEGGCVLKYAPTNNARLTVTGPITYGASVETPGVMPWHGNAPIIMTARDDHSVGAPIGANPLAGVYASKALDLDSYASGMVYDISDVRISHAALGLSFFEGHGHVARNLQLVNCREAIQAYHSTFKVLNGLLHRVTTAFAGSGADNATGNVQHVTFNQCSNLNSATLKLYATNSLFVAVTNLTSFTGAYNGTNNDPAVALQTLGAGANYLANGSPFRNAGTTNIEPALLSALTQLTTYPPVIAGHLVILQNTNLTLNPQAGRDTDTPDLGWHYRPLDFAFGGTYVINSTLIFNPGTAIALYSPTNGGSSYYGIGLSDNAKLFCAGTADNLNRIVRYNTVQEQSQTTWNTPPAEHIASDWTDPPVDPQARFRFTQWSIPAADTYHFRGHHGSDLVGQFRDCRFLGGRFQTERPTLNVTNCVFYRTAVLLEGNDYELDATFQNNLFYGGSNYLYQALGGAFTFNDNVFDCVAIAQLATPTHDYNGYITNASAQWLTNGGSHNVFTNTFTWQPGTLGQFYQPTNSPFLTLGSTNAHLLGLYHYTVLTNNVKETNSLVDIGFHYVATDATGNPLDADSDGIPDYLEDTTGNGSVNSGEGDWQSAGDAGLKVRITRPKNGAILP
jgi:hypothetical protein